MDIHQASGIMPGPGLTQPPSPRTRSLYGQQVFSEADQSEVQSGIRQAKVEIRLGILEIRLAAGSSPEGIMVNLGQLRGDHCSKPDRLQEKVAWEISWKPEKLYVILGQKLGGPLGWPPD
ncbi:uncharacterized protein LOC107140716 isoform X7 [Marmota marmota marmota]|uniref:uncharacterized protein LOC107140716 isoform X7 n=2 Tax=Marmota TaxID=9992 RepID=UPI002093ED23|nr:uncharacterized protein LOC107140716 isoform X7 [Marmota marmota marmota]